MEKNESNIELSATDLLNFVGCRHRAALNLADAQGQVEKPTWVDPIVRVLQERGREHERRYLDSLVDDGLLVLDLSQRLAASEKTLEAMRDGTPVIVQAILRRGRWHGRAGLLRRVEIPSRLGKWSYEVVDTKLAFTTRGGALLQLLLCCDLLGEIQGVPPARFHVISHDESSPIQTFLLADYSAYFRLLRAQLETLSQTTAIGVGDADYPEPTVHCDGCSWEQRCDSRRRQDDHLSLVAGISRLHRRELEAAGIRTLAALGRLPPDFPFRPRRASIESLVRAREQARIQLAARETGSRMYELLPIIANRGFTRLPEPQTGDVFIAIEGNPFITDGGRDFLFSMVIIEADGTHRHLTLWAITTADECSALARVVAEIERSWATHPDMHIYHYGPYESLVLKHLTGRYAKCEASLGRLLRADRFVDLHLIVQNVLRASVERYSLQQLEPFYHFERQVPHVVARQALRVVERALEFGLRREFDNDTRVTVEGYSLDICLSVRNLRDWLERLRADVIASGQQVSRPSLPDSAVSEDVSPHQERVDAVVAALTAGLPFEEEERTENQQASWLLAQLVDWHRREAKAVWWEFIRLWDLADYELLDEKAALSELTFIARKGGAARSPIDQYSFPDQETEIREGDQLYRPGTGRTFGRVAAIDPLARTVDIKKRMDQADEHPTAVFTQNLFSTQVLEEALLRLAEDIVAEGVDNATRHRAAAELLRARPPRLANREPFGQAVAENVVGFAVRVATKLDQAVLVVQGPPGSGKTFTAASMICELVKQGARVGVTGMSQKVINHLLEMVLRVADDSGVSVTCARKAAELSEAPGRVAEYLSFEEIESLLVDRCPPVVGGTPWLWAREKLQGQLDVLFVEEAGQMSLANVLVVSQCARNLVLLGDPRQLEQPQRGTHPPGADRSAVAHMLQDRQAISGDRGIFLRETWRLPPTVCAFTSEVFYESKLHARAGLEKREIRNAGPIVSTGLWTLPVMHEGNQDGSLEEVDAIEKLLDQVFTRRAEWVDQHTGAHFLSAADILIVAPYNAQVALLARRFASRGFRVGTVDKFQGQEAPIVIYSMATSAPEDAPRGIEFLYSLNRLNVATSRAVCACVLVACPRLFTPECKTPREMKLANALCRYVEMAKTLSLTVDA
jgi:uncharacterized protein